MIAANIANLPKLLRNSQSVTAKGPAGSRWVVAKNVPRVGGAHSLGKARAPGFVGLSTSNRTPRMLLQFAIFSL